MVFLRSKILNSSMHVNNGEVTRILIGPKNLLHVYDIVAIDPSIESLPIEFFEPMVKRVFSGSRVLPDMAE